MYEMRGRVLEIVAFRLGCCILSTTWFVPDEYFQGVEVAYRMVYGKGFLAWEWMSEWALRTTLHPFLYAIPFWVLKLVSLDFGCLIRWSPNVVHALLFACADVFYIKWTGNLLVVSNSASNLLLTLYYTNWFILYCSTRTLSNTIECCLTLIALYFYSSSVDEEIEKAQQYAKMKKDLVVATAPSSSAAANFTTNQLLKKFGFCVMLVTLAAVFRPTACLLWAPLCFCHFWEHSIGRTKRRRRGEKKFVDNTINNNNGVDVVGVGNGDLAGTDELVDASKYLARLLPFAAIPLILAFALDSFNYGRPTLTLWNFFRFNVLRGGSKLFGSHPWHWYFSQGLPSTLGLGCVPLLMSLLCVVSSNFPQIPKRYAIASIFYIVAHSFIAHKEHRFVLPVIPLLLPYIAVEINAYKRVWVKNLLTNLIVFSNLVAIVYFGIVHQRGPYAASAKVADFVGKSLQTHGNNNYTVNVLQLLPCFSMPMYAALHPYSGNVQIRMLDCGINLSNVKTLDESNITTNNLLVVNKKQQWFSNKNNATNINGGNEEEEQDESEQFHSAPERWLNARWYSEGFYKMDLIVCYEHIFHQIETFLMQQGFKRYALIFHTFFTSSERQHRRIVILSGEERVG